MVVTWCKLQAKQGFSFLKNESESILLDSSYIGYSSNNADNRTGNNQWIFTMGLLLKIFVCYFVATGKLLKCVLYIFGWVQTKYWFIVDFSPGVYCVHQIQWLPCQFTDEHVSLNAEGHVETQLIHRQAMVQFGQKGDTPVNPQAITFLITGKCTPSCLKIDSQGQGHKAQSCCILFWISILV